jgi:hypothetical protein
MRNHPPDHRLIRERMTAAQPCSAPLIPLVIPT